MKELFDLYMAFLRIGSVTFGGGYAMLPILQKDLEEQKGWTTTDELMDYFAIGQCTPGIIALNVATFVGYKKKGIPGSIAATIGFLTAPIFFITIIAMFLKNFASYPVVQHAFAGIRVCVCVLILQAIMRLWKKSIPDTRAFVLYAVIFFLTAGTAFLPFSMPAASLVILSGLFGILFKKEVASDDDADSTVH